MIRIYFSVPDIIYQIWHPTHSHDTGIPKQFCYIGLTSKWRTPQDVRCVLKQVKSQISELRGGCSQRQNDKEIHWYISQLVVNLKIKCKKMEIPPQSRTVVSQPSYNFETAYANEQDNLSCLWWMHADVHLINLILIQVLRQRTIFKLLIQNFSSWLVWDFYPPISSKRHYKFHLHRLWMANTQCSLVKVFMNRSQKGTTWIPLKFITIHNWQDGRYSLFRKLIHLEQYFLFALSLIVHC